LLAESDVPGAAAAVWDGRSLHEAASGVLNLATGVEATTDSVFQVGSISKVYTATLAMQLVDARQLDLDEPIASYLPDLELGDPDATATITMRHLLTHSSGIDIGDYMGDFGTGDDACARYVASLAGFGQVHPPGTFSSYSNGGYALAGRVIEIITGKTWHQALADLLLVPAGLMDSVSLPEQALLRRASVGHVADTEGQLVVHPQWRLPHAIAAAGSCLCTTAADLVRFGLLHASAGKVQNGDQVVSASSVAEMQAKAFDGLGAAPARGLGWELSTSRGTRVIAHGGGTLGQHAYLAVLPDLGFVVGAVTNGPNGGQVLEGVLGLAYDRLLGAAEATADVRPTRRSDVDITKYAGRYRRSGVDLVLEVDGDELTWTSTLTGELSGLLPTPPPIRLVPVDDLLLAVLGPDGNPYPGAIALLEPDADGRPRYVAAGHIARRVD
jgi:CubicO group peptidase (beta-lactamase class C family)